MPCSTWSADVAGAIEALSPGAPAVIVGHDWGAPIVWNTALIRPDRVRAVAGLSVPYMGVPTRSFSDMIEQVFTTHGRFFYQHYFQAEGVAEAELEADVRGGLRRFYYAISGDAPDGTWPTDKVVGDTLLHRLPDPDPFPAWLTDADLDYYVGRVRALGLPRPDQPLPQPRPRLRLSEAVRRPDDRPAGAVHRRRAGPGAGDDGPDKPAELVAAMRAGLTDLRGADILPGCGHWTQQERPAEVNQRLVAWLKGL